MPPFSDARQKLVDARPIGTPFLKPSCGDHRCPRRDKLTIETPEQTALEFPLAGIGSRVFGAVRSTRLLQGSAR